MTSSSLFFHRLLVVSAVGLSFCAYTLLPAAAQDTPLSAPPAELTESPGEVPAAQPTAIAPPPTTEAEVLTPVPLVDESIVPAPTQAGLQSPENSAAGVPVDPAAVAGAAPIAPSENLFFDSEALPQGAPGGEMRSALPHNVNPEFEPSNGVVIVKKDYAANTSEAQVISAQRAILLGRYDSALRIYDALYEKNPNDPEVLLGRAIALQKLGRNEQAVAAYETLLDARPDNLEAKINMLGLIGERYPAVALQRLQELEANNPHDVRILAQAALLEAKFGRYEDALASLGTAASLDENNANHVFNMAVIADRAGKKDDAIHYYEQALEIDTVYGGSHSIPRDAVYERLAQLR